MILSVTFARSITGGPFAGGSDSWSHKRHYLDAQEKVTCVRNASGVLLAWDGTGEHVGKRMLVTVPAANIVQIFEVEDAPAKDTKK